MRTASPLTSVVGQALGAAHLGGQIQRPQTGGMAEVARAAVQQRAQLLGALAGEGPRRRLVRTRGAFLQRGQPLGVEGDGGHSSTVWSSQPSCSAIRGDPLAARAGEQDLAAAQDEGVRGAQARSQRLPLGVRERTHKDGSSHAAQRTTFSTTFGD